MLKISPFAKRVFVPAADPRNANIFQQYPIDEAAWLWHPDHACSTLNSSVEFRLDFNVAAECDQICSVSADNRYELYLDGEYVSMGPDRGDVDHWAFSTYKIHFTQGKHTLNAECRYYQNEMPLAQLMYHPGFIFSADDPEFRKIVNTGIAPWRVRILNGIQYSYGGWATGCAQVLHVKDFFSETPFVDPVVEIPPRQTNDYGGKIAGWRLYPTNLPEQIRKPFDLNKIRVRAVLRALPEKGAVPVSADDAARAEEMAEWQQALAQGQVICVPAFTTIGVLIDFQTYICAYPELAVHGGESSFVRISWGESLHEAGDCLKKKNRSSVAGKFFPDPYQWDVFDQFDGVEHTVTTPWWRAGRYALLIVKNKEKPLFFDRIRFLESRYPLEAESKFAADDENLNKIQPMMIRAMQMCMHETFMDCPYYEQLMYVGDTRLEILTAMTMQRNAALPLRALHLFDWSRSVWSGLVAEHYPGRGSQLSATFSSIWPLIVRDYMMYRRFSSDREFFHLRRSVRAMLQSLADYVNDDGLIENLPGWSFVDWVDEWRIGIPYPKDNRAMSSIFSLHYLNALRAAIELENYLPEQDNGLAGYFEKCFRRTADAVKKRFFVPERGLFADDPTLEHFSVHAQCLALLSGVLTGDEAEACLKATLTAKDIAQPTLYFIYYLFETLARFGQGEKILDHADIWTHMLELGAVTTWECPEPTRSDCHAWGAHMYHHYFVSIAGIRPASPGFRTVSVRPAMGHLKKVCGKMVHPDGMIEFELIQPEPGRYSGRIVLPDGVTGSFLANGKEIPLISGENRL